MIDKHCEERGCGNSAASEEDRYCGGDRCSQWSAFEPIPSSEPLKIGSEFLEKLDDAGRERLVASGSVLTVDASPLYGTFRQQLRDLHDRVAVNKGAKLHGGGEPWEQQISHRITRRVGLGYPLGQVEKKLDEALRVAVDDPDKAYLQVLDCAALYLIVALHVREEARAGRKVVMP